MYVITAIEFSTTGIADVTISVILVKIQSCPKDTTYKCYCEQYASYFCAM